MHTRMAMVKLPQGLFTALWASVDQALSIAVTFSHFS